MSLDTAQCGCKAGRLGCGREPVFASVLLDASSARGFYNFSSLGPSSCSSIHLTTCISQMHQETWVHRHLQACNFVFLDGGGSIDSGAFTSCLRGVSKTTEPTINGESICGVATTSTGRWILRPGAQVVRAISRPVRRDRGTTSGCICAQVKGERAVTCAPPATGRTDY